MLNVDIYSNFVSLFIELFVTVRILGPGHVIDSLVWMFLLHEVVNEVPEQDGLAGDVGVMDCHLMRIMFNPHANPGNLLHADEEVDIRGQRPEHSEQASNRTLRRKWQYMEVEFEVNASLCAQLTRKLF